MTCPTLGADDAILIRVVFRLGFSRGKAATTASKRSPVSVPCSALTANTSPAPARRIPLRSSRRLAIALLAAMKIGLCARRTRSNVGDFFVGGGDTGRGIHNKDDGVGASMASPACSRICG